MQLKASKGKDEPLYLYKRLYSVEEAAQFLAISPKTIRNGLGRRAEKPFPVPHKKYGKRVVFDVKDLNLWVDRLPYGNALYLGKSV